MRDEVVDPRSADARALGQRGVEPLGDLVHDDAEHDRRTGDRGEAPPGPKHDGEADHESQKKRPLASSGGLQRLERCVDEDCADRSRRSRLPAPPSTTIAYTVISRTMSKLAGKIAPCCAAKIAPGEARDARADRERHELEPVDRHRHELGGELVLSERAPRAPGARLVDEVEDGHDDEERRTSDVVGAVERRDLLPEERQRLDVRDAVRPSRELTRSARRRARSGGRRASRWRGSRRRAVATAGRSRKPTSAVDDDDERERPLRVPVAPRVLGRKRRVQVRADAEERDVAEVEEADPADDDVQPEREQDEDERVDRRPASGSPSRRRAGRRRTGAASAMQLHDRRRRSYSVDRASTKRWVRASLSRDPLVDADSGLGC